MAAKQAAGTYILNQQQGDPAGELRVPLKALLLAQDQDVMLLHPVTARLRPRQHLAAFAWDRALSRTLAVWHLLHVAAAQQLHRMVALHVLAA